MLSGRLFPIFGIRAFYTMADAILPFAFSSPLRIFRPDVELAIDGAIWILTCYSLIGLLKPDTNWVHRRRSQLRRVVEANEGGRADTTSPERGIEEPDNTRSSHSSEERNLFTRWFSTSKPNWQPQSKIPPGTPPSPVTGQPPSADESSKPLPAREEATQRKSLLARLNPLLESTYGSTGSTSRSNPATSGKGNDPDSDQRPLISGDDEDGERVHAAVIQGSNGMGENVLYAQDGPMAPAWVLQGIAKGHVGTAEDLRR
jgi:hypothetical protein